MANWWDAAPLAEGASSVENGRQNTVRVTPAAGANWWDAAPLAQEAKPAQAPQQAAEPSMSMPQAIMRGAEQGLSFNFSDELKGVKAAAPEIMQTISKLGASFPGGQVPAHVAGALNLLKDYFGGDGEATKRYDETVSADRAANKTAETERPNSFMGGQIAGAVAVPLGGMGGAAGLLPRIAQGAGIGAVTGGLAGAGEGDGAVDRLTRGASGAALGAGVGAVLPVGVEGVVRGARAIATPVANAVRGIRKPEEEAARRVALSVEKDMKLDPAASGRLSSQEFAAGRAAGDPVNIMDIGGETTRALARSAANTSPEGRAALTKAIDDRFEGQAPRVTEWLGKNFNYPDAGALQEAIQQTAKSVNRPAYAKAYAKGQALWDGDLEQFSQAPVVQQAIRLAFVTGRNRDTLAGFAPFKNPFVLNKTTNTLELQQGATPNLQFWDHVKRNLDGLGAEGQAFSKALRGHLDQLVPEYQTARGGAAMAFGAEDALEAGRKFVTAKMDPNDAARAIGKFSPLEKKVFQDGVVSQFTKVLNDVGDRRSILNKIAESPNARRNLELALGPQKANELEAMLRVEGIMDMARPAVQGNSTTARQLAELGLAGGTYTIGTGGNIMNPDASALANVLRGIKIVANNKQLFNSLRAADKGLARIGGQQSTGFAPMQAAGIGRADEQQQGVQRPPGQ
jgi:hypothetical protein